MSLAAAADGAEDLTAVVERLSRRVVRRLVAVRGGGNNRLFRAETDDGPIAVKHYPKDLTEKRGRLAVEYEALAFLARGGVRAVPRPLARGDDYQLALYEWIDGEKIETPDAPAIEAAVALLGDMHRLSGTGQAEAWSRTASASVFCPAEATRQAAARRSQFSPIAAEAPALRAFLAEYDALVPEIVEKARLAARRDAIAWDIPLASARRTLSPSDFGFHNALRRVDGSVVFLDFEYFGWDDPAKLCNDFMMHPGMALPAALAERFETGARALYGSNDADFAARLHIMFPLCGLCWCMIILNPFLATSRRRDEDAQPGDSSANLEVQLDKARSLLARVDGFAVNPPESRP